MKHQSPERDSDVTWYNVFEFEQRHNGTPIKLYNGIIKADDLVQRYTIPEYKTGSDSGYQRPVYTSRLGHIATYVLTKEGVMPTSILVNIREGASYQSTNGSFGILRMKTKTLLWVVDGQHRTKGLELAAERKQPLPYELPIIFAIGLSEEQEMDLFYVVNSTQKSVPTDLTFEIMRKRIDRKASSGQSISNTELRRFASVEVVRELALDEQSVWFNKIQMADEVKQYHKPVRLATFAKSLDAFLSSDWASNLVTSRDSNALTLPVKNFWAAINILAPAAISDPKVYSLQGPTAVWVFGWVLRDMIRFADKADDFSPEFFAEKLTPLAEWIDSDTWHREHGLDLTRAKGAGVARLIFEKVHELYAHPEVPAF